MNDQYSPGNPFAGMPVPVASPSVTARIKEVRASFGPRLSIVGHHYQTDAVAQHLEVIGDSLELARKVAALESEHIVFCGVFFMAESAAILARQGQKVYLPEPGSDCAMAQMSKAQTLAAVLKKLADAGLPALPLTYVNSSVAVKAVVGKAGGAVCTSANARRMMEWAFERSERVLFVPDRNLGDNVADQLGLPQASRKVIDIRRMGDSLDMEAAKSAKLLLWPGFCPIHEAFTPDHVSAARAAYPGAKVIVHPESPAEVVGASDGAGSTSYIIKYVQEAPAGSTIVVGTEVNLVHRLAQQNRGRVTVVPLKVSSCVDMCKTTEANLLACLESIVECEAGRLPLAALPTLTTVAENEAEPARLALERMLDACK